MSAAGSSARPLGFALFEKRLDTLAKIGALADSGIFADGGLNLRVEFGAGGLGEQALGLEKRERTVLRQLQRQFASPVEQFFSRNDLIDQAQSQGLRRVKQAPSEQQIAGNLFSDLA